MPAHPEDFKKRTAAWLQEKVGRLPAGSLDSFIDDAVKQYGADVPYEVVADLAGAGTHDIALPSDFVDGFSELRSVEYPIGDVPESMIDSNAWSLYRSPNGLKLRLVDYGLTAQQSARVTYTAYRSIGTDGAGGAAATIPDIDVAAVCALAASYAALEIANTYNQSVDPNTDAAFMATDDRKAAYRTAATELRAIYERRLRIKSDGKGNQESGKGQAFVDLDPKLLGVTENVTHPRRWF